MNDDGPVYLLPYKEKKIYVLEETFNTYQPDYFQVLKVLESDPCAL